MTFAGQDLPASPSQNVIAVKGIENAMYYIALIAPEKINEEVTNWKHFMRDRFGCTAALKSPAHITLISPFWMKTDLQPTLEKTMNDFSVSQSRFPVSLKNFDCFKQRVIFVYVENSARLECLKSDLESHLLNNSFDFKQDLRPFHPHITIANRDLHKKDFIEGWDFFREKQYTATFIADGVTLMRHSGSNWESVYTGSFPFT